MPDSFYVYVLFRPWDGSPCYVGKGRGNRWLTHAAGRKRLHNRHLSNIFSKAEKLGLDVPRVKIRSDVTELEAFAIEAALIAAIGRLDRHGGSLVNLTDGGEGASGAIRSMEMRAKKSAAMAGNKNSLGSKRDKETRAKLRAIALSRPDEYKSRTRDRLISLNRGKKLSASHREKMAAAKRGKKQSAEHVAKRALSNTGKRRSAETRSKMSAAQAGNKNCLGRIVGEEARAKISEGMMGNTNGCRGYGG